MTDDELAAIEARHAEAESLRGECNDYKDYCRAAVTSSHDVNALVAEVKRLRAICLATERAGQDLAAAAVAIAGNPRNINVPCVVGLAVAVDKWRAADRMKSVEYVALAFPSPSEA